MVRVPGSSGDAGFHLIKKEEGSEDLQSPGRSSAIEVKVEYEEKPQNPPPFVFVGEDNMGHNKYYGPGAPSLTGKLKNKGPRNKSPNLPLKKHQDWTEEDLEEAYYQSKLKSFLRKDPVMKTLKVKLLDQVHGPITALPIATTDLEVLKALINLLHEAGMAAGNFTAETLFDFGFETLKKTLIALHGHIKALVVTG
ncbi:unnamed protein product [Peronospora farinosa]|uniref:Uncharacterized protein n=1 Tax=Peronospora farinosa TaxID=134698 RepID=A0ABN8CLP6_9STRA|nr:unnamed protein product [Peronospora farinosa]